MEMQKWKRKQMGNQERILLFVDILLIFGVL
jgi:hypothetical protein